MWLNSWIGQTVGVRFDGICRWRILEGRTDTLLVSLNGVQSQVLMAQPLTKQVVSWFQDADQRSLRGRSSLGRVPCVGTDYSQLIPLYGGQTRH